MEAAAEALAIPATEAICKQVSRQAGEVLTKYEPAWNLFPVPFDGQLQCSKMARHQRNNYFSKIK
jgi:hypothetical protein